MRTVPAGILANLQADVADTAICWLVEKNNGTYIRGTEHDDDIAVPPLGSPDTDIPGSYLAGSNISGSDVKSSSDMSVDNTEVDGAISDNDVTVTDLTVADIEGGLFDNAPVTLFLVNWKNPENGVVILRRGFLGDVSRDSDFHYKTEIRGLAQLLSQNIIRSYSETCDVVRLGGFRCNINIAPMTITATVTAVTNRKRFTILGFTDESNGFFSLGILKGLTGANVGFERQVKNDSFNNTFGFLDLWDPMPADVEIGDTFSLEPGCDRRVTTCTSKFGNINNYQGYGLYIPGILALLKSPTT